MPGEKERKLKKQKLLEKLVPWGVVSSEQMAQAKTLAREKQVGLSQALHDLGFTFAADIQTAVSEHFGIPYVDLDHFIPDHGVLTLLSEEEARKLQVLPLFRLKNFLMISVADPLDIGAVDRVEELTGLEVGKAFSDQAELEKIIDRTYGGMEEPERMAEELEEELVIPTPAGEEKAEAVKVETPAPITDLVSAIIKRAVRDRASDVHISPEADQVQVKFRIDGILQPVLQLSKKNLSSVVSHIKVLSNLDISISMRPQDGEFHSSLPGGDIDVRVSVLPTIYGENVVMRILNAGSLTMDLKDLGFSPYLFKGIGTLIARPHGIILVTGPTGSGKTTTLYSILGQLNTEEANIITVEDPVEYKLAGIRQVQVNPRAGLTFANALRSIVRQDPDIIMIGEIRDLETAEIAVQSALTGHLVFGTLHTNDAPTAVTRLAEMGVQPFLVASSVTGILAQRLVRMICPDCKEPSPRDTRILRDLDLVRDWPGSKIKAFRGRGCDRCRDTGYLGRTTIAELMVMDDELGEMVTKNDPTSRIARRAREKGMSTLLEDGIQKVVGGITTLEEVHRVVEIKTDTKLEETLGPENGKQGEDTIN